MNGMYPILGLLVLMTVAPSQQLGELDDLTDVVNLTAENFDDVLVNNHMFVLFYEAG